MPKPQIITVWQELQAQIISKFSQTKQDQQSDFRTILSGLLTINRRTPVVLTDQEEVSLGSIILGLERMEEILANLGWTVGRGNYGGSSNTGFEYLSDEDD